MNWMIPLLGIVLVGGLYAAARSYLGFQRQIDAGVEFEAAAERIFDALSLMQVQRGLQSGGCPEAARSLDNYLSDSIAALDGQLASADERTRSLIRAFFDAKGLRSQNSPIAAGLAVGRSDTELAAQTIFAQGLAGAAPAK